MSTTLDIIKPALDALDVAYAEHPLYNPRREDGTYACACGFVGTSRVPSRSVGLHVAAARNRAEKVYDAQCARLINARR